MIECALCLLVVGPFYGLIAFIIGHSFIDAIFKKKEELINRQKEDIMSMVIKKGEV